VSFNIFSKLLQFKKIDEFYQTGRINTLTFEKLYLKTLYLNTLNSYYYFSDLFLNKYKKNKKGFLYFDHKFSSFFSPKILTFSIVEQIKRYNNKLKSKNFSFGLNIGIAKLVNKLLAKYKKNIVGIKIICSGKWKKTRSGRKQIFVYKKGQLRNSTISNVIFFDFITQKTKFGSCGIKVWIAQKRNI